MILPDLRFPFQNSTHHTPVRAATTLAVQYSLPDILFGPRSGTIGPFMRPDDDNCSGKSHCQWSGASPRRLSNDSAQVSAEEGAPHLTRLTIIYFRYSSSLVNFESWSRLIVSIAMQHSTPPDIFLPSHSIHTRTVGQFLSGSSSAGALASAHAHATPLARPPLTDILITQSLLNRHRNKMARASSHLDGASMPLDSPEQYHVTPRESYTRNPIQSGFNDFQCRASHQDTGTSTFQDSVQPQHALRPSQSEPQTNPSRSQMAIDESGGLDQPKQDQGYDGSGPSHILRERVRQYVTSSTATPIGWSPATSMSEYNKLARLNNLQILDMCPLGEFVALAVGSLLTVTHTEIGKLPDIKRKSRIHGRLSRLFLRKPESESSTKTQVSDKKKRKKPADHSKDSKIDRMVLSGKSLEQIYLLGGMVRVDLPYEYSLGPVLLPTSLAAPIFYLNEHGKFSRPGSGMFC